MFQSMLKTNTVTRFLSKKYSMAPKKSKNKAEKDSTANVASKTPSVKGPIKYDSDKNILIEVHAKPGAKQNAITDVNHEGINIQINAPPVEGSANTELVKYIASFLGLKSSAVSLERGHKSRNKVLKVTGNISLIEVVQKFNAELPPDSKIPEES